MLVCLATPFQKFLAEHQLTPTPTFPRLFEIVVVALASYNSALDTQGVGADSSRVRVFFLPLQQYPL